jgi:hypothetical protein
VLGLGMNLNANTKKNFVYRVMFKFLRLLKVLIYAIRKENHLSQVISWESDLFEMPAPHFIKQHVVLRNVIKGSTIIETGTYTGETSKLLLTASDKVLTIEPDKTLYTKAHERFMENQGIEVLNGTSEEIFPNLLPKISGDISFWLDGHFTGEGSFKGKLDSPIKVELFEIQKNMKNFKKICILVDDVRCFNSKLPEYSGYPPIDFLTDWAITNGFNWSIESDIFIAKNY